MIDDPIIMRGLELSEIRPPGGGIGKVEAYRVERATNTIMYPLATFLKPSLIEQLIGAGWRIEITKTFVRQC